MPNTAAPKTFGRYGLVPSGTGYVTTAGPTVDYGSLSWTDRLNAVKPTFGSLFKPASPNRAPTSKVTVTCDAYVSNWDALGPSYTGSAMTPYIKLNGLPITNAYGISVDPSGQASAKVLDIETIFTGKNCSIMHYWLSGADPSFVRVFIDGEEIDFNPLSVNGVAQWYLNFNFAVYGTYKIRIVGGYFINTIACNSGSTFHKPDPRKAIGITSDSYFESIFNGVVADSVPAQLATVTGCDVWNGAQGGTGYINPGAGGLFSPYGSAARLAALAAMNIDVLLVNGSINDQAYPITDVQAAMVKYFADVAKIKPGLPIVVVGLQSVTYTGLLAPPALANLVTAQKAACVASPNVVGYIDPYTVPWLTGSGDEGATSGTGNQNFLIGGTDHIHPSARGSKHYATLIRDHMAPLKASL